MIENNLIISNPSLQEVLAYGFEKYEKKNKLDPRVIEVIDQLISCKTSSLGGHKSTCEGCGNEVIEYNSCRNKCCPQCSEISQKNWFFNRADKLLRGNYHHLIFKLPQDLNKVFLNNKLKVGNSFFKTVKKILVKIFRKSKKGITMQLHTDGSVLSLHPHIHCLISEVGVDKFGNLENNGIEFDLKKLQLEFKKRFLKEFFKLKDLKYKMEMKKYLEINVNRFDVYLASSGKIGIEILEYFSKKVRGGVIENSRILELRERTVKFTYRNKNTDMKESEMVLSIDEFIKRICLHIPAKYQRTVRHYGLFSSYHVLELRKLQKELGIVEIEEEEPREKTCIICNSVKFCNLQLKKIKHVWDFSASRNFIRQLRLIA